MTGFYFTLKLCKHIIIYRHNNQSELFTVIDEVINILTIEIHVYVKVQGYLLTI